MLHPMQLRAFRPRSRWCAVASHHDLSLTTPRQGQGSRRERAVFPVLADGSAMAARIAPLCGITDQSMRQATRRRAGRRPAAREGPQVRPHQRRAAHDRRLPPRRRRRDRLRDRLDHGGTAGSEGQGRDLGSDGSRAPGCAPAAVDRRGSAGVAGHVAAPASLLALAAWQPGHGAMQARRPAMGSDSTISRSGHQGPPLPGTDSPEALSFNILPNIGLESGCTRS
jgi:hypothetical protein